MVQSEVITNKHDATISVQVVNDVINIQEVIRMLNKNDVDVKSELGRQMGEKLHRLIAGWS